MAIIAVLATLVVGAINVARIQARNTQRINDLRTIQTALTAYQIKYHNWIEADSGCGWGGSGNGWFNQEDSAYGGYYSKSIMKCLKEAGMLQTDIIDPSGETADGYAYMKYTCPDGKTYLYAKLEGGSADSATMPITCNPGYGMNYVMSLSDKPDFSNVTIYNSP